jgi:heme/copper-type cytochrome/quinol oxidase subunit 3
MASIRVFAILTLGLLAVYYVLRAVVAQCSGNQCDVYIPLSLLLPLLILVMAAVTGLLAILSARQGAQRAWVGVLGVCTLLGVLGPIVSAVIFRDSPDVLVPLATVLVLLAPLSALIYSFSAPTPGRQTSAS